MKKDFSIKHFLITLLIPLLKLLILLKKLITAFFVYVIFKPLKFILGGIFHYPLVKVYGYYILSLKKLREFNARHKSQFAIFRKFFSVIIVGAISLIIIINNLINQPQPENLSNDMVTTPLARSGLVNNEFSDMPNEELITESALTEEACLASNQSNINNAILNPYPHINTNVAPIDTETEISCLAANNQALLKPGIIATQPAVEASETTPQKRATTIIYIVKSGDNITTIARQFNINATTILWANDLTAYSPIHENDKLRIPPVSGVLVKIKSGDNLRKIADKYSVSVEQIISANNLSSAGKLVIGQEIIVPNARKISDIQSIASNNKPKNIVSAVKSLIKPKEKATVSGTKLQWPTQGYRITQYYSWRHTGLDIGNKVGTPLYASEDGVVETSGWNSGGYGYMVLINHGNGIKTRYAHASKLFVSSGERVSRGQVIAYMGSTGRSTGPHIHYEVYVGGKRVNPLNYIK
jgi:LysM repeat protein